MRRGGESGAAAEEEKEVTDAALFTEWGAAMTEAFGVIGGALLPPCCEVLRWWTKTPLCEMSWRSRLDDATGSRPTPPTAAATEEADGPLRVSAKGSLWLCCREASPPLRPSAVCRCGGPADTDGCRRCGGGSGGAAPSVAATGDGLLRRIISRLPPKAVSGGVEARLPSSPFVLPPSVSPPLPWGRSLWRWGEADRRAECALEFEATEPAHAEREAEAESEGGSDLRASSPRSRERERLFLPCEDGLPPPGPARSAEEKAGALRGGGGMSLPPWDALPSLSLPLLLV